MWTVRLNVVCAVLTLPSSGGDGNGLVVLGAVARPKGPGPGVIIVVITEPIEAVRVTGSPSESLTVPLFAPSWPSLTVTGSVLCRHCMMLLLLLTNVQVMFVLASKDLEIDARATLIWAGFAALHKRCCHDQPSGNCSVDGVNAVLKGDGYLVDRSLPLLPSSSRENRTVVFHQA